MMLPWLRRVQLHFQLLRKEDNFSDQLFLRPQAVQGSLNAVKASKLQEGLITCEA